MFSAEFIYFDCPGATHAHCASLAAAPDGTLIAAFYVYPEEETHDAKIVIARKNPGDDWREAKPVELGMASTLANPVLFLDPSGVLWLHFVALKGSYWDTAVWYSARSTDLGVTFETPRLLNKEEGLMVRHHPVVLENGNALMPIYSDRTKESFIYESRPPYKDWKRTTAFPGEHIIQPSLIRSGPRLMLFFRPGEEPRNTWRSISTDHGKSWSSPVRLPLPNPLSGMAALIMNNRVGLVYNHTTEHQRFPISIAWSDLTLQDWSEPLHIDSPGFEVSYPAFIVDAKNVVHGVYTFNRKFIKYVTFDESWTKENHARD